MTGDFKKAMLLSASLMILAGYAQAADVVEASDAAEAASDQGLEAVIVVGEKRSGRLQKVPLAVTALSADTLQQANVNQISDVNGLVPGLTVAKNGGAERVVSMRGIGYETAQNPNSQPGVAFHIDGVYVAHVMALAQDLLDVERLEVLRGPQGTLFGQASTGGAINVITRQPRLGEYGGNLSGSLGNYAYKKGSATVNVPMGETFALRASVQAMKHTGYGKAIGVVGVDEYDLDDADTIGGRVSLLWQPTSDFRATLNVQSFSANQGGALQKNVTDTHADPRVVYQDYPSFFKIRTNMAYLNMEKDFGDLTLKSVTAYQQMYKNQGSDNDRSAGAHYDHIVKWTDTSRALSQELSLSNGRDAQFEWVVGAFYLVQHARQDILERIGDDANPDWSPSTNGIPYNLKYATNSPYQHYTLAGYAQGTFKVSDDFRITAGLRYTWDKTAAQPVNYFDMYGPTAPRKVNGTNVTGKVGFEYDLTPNNLIYATVSKGYKPKGVNFTTGVVVTPDFDDETVYSFELGSKNAFLDNRLRLNVSTYYYDYKNYQFTAEDPLPFSGGTDNIPKAEIYGAEFEGAYIFNLNWRVDGSLTLMEGKFKGDFYTLDRQTADAIRAQYPGQSPYFGTVLDAVIAGALNTDGMSVPKMPKVQGNFSVTYSHDFESGYLSVRAEAVHRGEFQYRVFNNSWLDNVPAYTIGNLYVKYEPFDKPYSFGLSVTNINDKAGINSRFTDPYGSLTTSNEYIAPRQAFATVNYKF
ncbi:MAG: TonB-dependent receptor [Asticcacaulis sp.]